MEVTGEWETFFEEEKRAKIESKRMESRWSNSSHGLLLQVLSLGRLGA